VGNIDVPHLEPVLQLGGTEKYFSVLHSTLLRTVHSKLYWKVYWYSKFLLTITGGFFVNFFTLYNTASSTAPQNSSGSEDARIEPRTVTDQYLFLTVRGRHPSLVCLMPALKRAFFIFTFLGPYIK
jgi:hypothetical protein